MDNIDYKILKILQKNARETASNISKEIHLSVSAVIERIRKLKRIRLSRNIRLSWMKSARATR